MLQRILQYRQAYIIILGKRSRESVVSGHGRERGDFNGTSDGYDVYTDRR